MTSEADADPGRERARAASLLVLCLLLFCYGLGSRALWDQDEGMHASTSRVMVETGDWVTPRFNGEAFYDKPILFTWAVSLGFVLLGFTELAARLPAALFGLSCVMLTFLLGRRLFDSRAGWLGAVVLATSAEFIVLSRVVVHDMALTFCVTLALYGFWRAFEARSGRLPWLALFYAGSGLAVLAKGPVGLLPPFVAGSFLLLSGRLDFVREIRPLLGGAVFAAVAAPWYLLAALADPDFAGYFLRDKVLGSLVDSRHLKAQPFHFYLPVLLGGLVPWTLVLPTALWHVARSVLRQQRPQVLFLLIWALAPLLVFSLASAKLPSYVLPVFPPFALLLGRALADLLEHPSEKLHRTFLWPTLLLGCVPPLLLVALQLHHPADLDRIGIGPAKTTLAALVLTLGLGGAALAMALRRYTVSVWATAATMVAGVMVFVHALAPEIDPFRSTRDVGWRIHALLPPGEPIPVFKRVIGEADSALFYTGRSGLALYPESELARHLAGEEPAFVVIREKRIAPLGSAVDAWHVVHHEGNKLILSNRSPDDPEVRAALRSTAASGPE